MISFFQGAWISTNPSSQYHSTRKCCDQKVYVPYSCFYVCVFLYPLGKIQFLNLQTKWVPFLAAFFLVLSCIFVTVVYQGNLSVMSLNVRGLRNQVKRRSIFRFLKDQNCLFYFLQEIYSKPGDETIWRREWGGDIFFSHGSIHSRGVCILMNPLYGQQL